MIQLGQKVQDKITGLVGIVIGRAEWLYGCIRCSVQPQELKDGKPVESTWIDEDQLEIVEATTAVSPPKKKQAVTSGGPRSDAQRGSSPQR